ncbi:MAG: fluoride efflux transporter CrcB [Gomphosphaeria aponina SAG 52.96 = DSM 107014]|uniref:Fluoride-specific ion channel FluC n=1 Tax=Gomphosphaeria aponina SAG 52.96 = DSM 107014 TaxID=1521640 RepID=A0A941JUU6_9CHRO|nr:fluoride efflux transporter CrcB [Gomphosphaeria aponina SAG 52.96 = DSM 107014]
MLKFLLIFGGGGLGSVCRYLVSQAIARRFDTNFPWGTLTVNLLGSFAIGIFIAFGERAGLNPFWSLLFVTGFCGGFTTFSSFAYENNFLLSHEDYLAVFVYTFLSLFWGFAATFLGIFLVKNI